jgi:hypothetical protein
VKNRDFSQNPRPGLFLSYKCAILRVIANHLISFLFRKYLSVAGWGILFEERLESVHLDFGEGAIILFRFILPVLPNANLSLGCSGVLVPSLQDEIYGLTAIIISHSPARCSR